MLCRYWFRVKNIVIFKINYILNSDIDERLRTAAIQTERMCQLQIGTGSCRYIDRVVSTESKWDLTALFACQQLYNILHCCVSRHFITVKETLQCRKCHQKEYVSKLSFTINFNNSSSEFDEIYENVIFILVWFALYLLHICLLNVFGWRYLCIQLYPWNYFYQQLLEKQQSADSQQCRWSQSVLYTSTSYHVSCAVESMT